MSPTATSILSCPSVVARIGMRPGLMPSLATLLLHRDYIFYTDSNLWTMMKPNLVSKDP